MDNPNMDYNPARTEEDREVICPICFCELGINPVQGRSCNHKFCKGCFYTWTQKKLSSGEIATCPMCRSILTDADFVQQLEWDVEEDRAVDEEDSGTLMSAEAYANLNLNLNQAFGTESAPYQEPV